MQQIKPEELWFNTPDSASLCRGGGNGPQHPTQLYAIKKYVKPDMSLLDYGCGSATTFEAMRKNGFKNKYLGLDIIPKNIEWCKANFPQGEWKVNEGIHTIDEPDRSWDVVYSRHVVDHMKNFEEAMNEHKRVSKDLVIVVLWVPFSNQDEHEIKNIDYRPSGGELFPNEYTNSYSKKKVLEYLGGDPKWELLECSEEIGTQVSGHDSVIVLKRNETT